MTTHFGATREEWSTWAHTYGLMADLLPVVSNPGATISAGSNLSSLGKIPSRYNLRREVVGIKGWPQHVTTVADIEQWMQEPDYGICLQTRTLHAIDVDVDCVDHARAIYECIDRRFGRVPVRYRSNSSRFLALVRLSDGERQTKRVMKTPHGNIEFLAHGQQCVIAGTHTSGTRYEWNVAGLPASWGLPC